MKITWLGALNFLVLQWFGVRLARRMKCVLVNETPITISIDWRAGTASLAGSAKVEERPDGYTLLRWIWPLTGWWSDYRRIAFGQLVTRRRFRWFQRIVRVRRIHHPRWSFGWAFPLTTWCRFEQRTGKDHDFEPPRPRTRPGHWKRCARSEYHDSTTTGRY